MPAPRARALPCLRIVLLGLLIAAPAAAQGVTVASALDEALGGLAPYAHSGVLYDRVLPLAHLESLDGGPDAAVADLARWRQAYSELRRASLVARPWPDLAALDAGARAALRAGVLPLAILDRAFERVRPEALADGSLRLAGGRLEPTGPPPLLSSRAVALAVLAPRTYRGSDLVFSLDPSRVFADEAPRSIAIDFADGRGPRTVTPGEPVRVRYAETGRHVLEAVLTRADGSVARGRFALEVAVAAPLPDDTLHVTATIPYQGVYGTGDAYVALAPGHAGIVNPVVVVEGFDLDNSMNWDELYALLDGQGLLETLRADGFDAVVLNFTDATEAVQQNAFVVAELIQQVQSRIDPQATLAVVGASMGGLCSRYALAWMEQHALAHRVRTWISFDGPQTGADIPLGLQYWIAYFASQSASAADFLAVLQRPAARQLLLYHLTDPPGTTGQPDPLRTTLLADLAAAGDYPALPRRVAIANGSGSALGQGFAPGDQLIRYEYSSFFLALTGNVWAVPDQASTRIFQGSQRILFSTTNENVTVSGTRPWDGAPGGSRASMAQLDTTTAPYGDIVALHPSHAFIPTVSALALATNDPFFDVAGAPDLSPLTPFDATYFPAVNEEHVLVTAANAAWVRDEVERGVLATPAGGPDPSRPRLTAAPDPFAASTRLTLRMPHAGRADLRVYGVDGREVRRLISGTFEAGTITAEWDGRDSRGAPAAPGLYFARGTSVAGSTVRRLVKLR